MESKTPTHQQIAKWALWCLLGSFAVFLSPLLLSRRPFTISTEGPGLLTLAVAALSAVISLLAFVVTTVLGWRKEQRETAAHELALVKASLEIERMRNEINALRAENRERSGDKPDRPRSIDPKIAEDL